MPVGPILLLILLVLIGTGYGSGSLLLLRLHQNAAAAFCLLALIGSAIEVPLAPGLTLNVGGTLVPLALSLLFAVTAVRPAGPAWASVAAGVTAGLLYQIGRIFPVNLPSELNFIYLDVQYLLAGAGAVLGCVTGRSARSAFAVAAIGVSAADLAHYVAVRSAGSIPTPALQVGGGGGAATAALAAVLAVVLYGLVKPQPVRFPPVSQSDRLT